MKSIIFLTLGVFAMLQAEDVITINYTNYRGEVADRHIIPKEIYYGSTDWHPEKQWLLAAYDVDREADRQFALSDIHTWLGKEAISHPKRDLANVRENLGDNHVLFDQLMEFPLGRFLLEHGGLNGYWIDYAIKGGDPSKKLEHTIINRLPIAMATRERFGHFQQAIQRELRSGMVLASLPCGVMSDLLEVDYTQVEDVQLVGIDLDPESIMEAAKRAGDLAPCTRFKLCDAWELNIQGEYDLLTSNGLNIYEPSDERVVALYHQFYNALKSGGVLVTSFVTPQPEWLMDEIDMDLLLLQKTLFVDVIGVKFQAYRTSSQTEEQLKSVGFTDVEFIYDRAHLFPTVVARKS